MVKQAGQVYALLADGTTVEIRPATPDDFDAVKAMHEAMSTDNTYMRFFNISRGAAEAEARRICLTPPPGSVALLAVAGGDVVGVASYAFPQEPASRPDDSERTAGTAPSPAPSPQSPAAGSRQAVGERFSPDRRQWPCAG